VTPEWFEECFKRNEVVDTKTFEIRAPLGPRDEMPQ
jgi:hypothetical protein